jgi:stress response protein YsnF
VLYKEIPVIEKRVVPAERVRVVKDTRTDEAPIAEEVRKERIRVERDARR